MVIGNFGPGFVVDATLMGLVLADGVAPRTGVLFPDQGGNMTVRSGATATMLGGGLVDGSAGVGGGALVHGTLNMGPLPEVTSSEGLVIDNEALTGSGGGIMVGPTGRLVATDVLFKGNTTVLDGGAVASDKATSVTLDSCRVGTLSSPNTAGRNGGGISSRNTMRTRIISDVGGAASVIAHNTAAASGGGVHNHWDRFGLWVGASLAVEGTSVEQNTAGVDGGGVQTTLAGGFGVAASRAVSVSDSAFVDNSAGVDGGGLHIRDTGTAQFEIGVTVNDTHFGDNIAVENGGGLVLEGPMISTIASSNFAENDSGMRGGAMHVSNIDALGAVVDVQGSIFGDNQTTECGGAIAVEDIVGATIGGSDFTANEATGVGGGFCAQSKAEGVVAQQNVNLDSSHFHANRANRGAGAYVGTANGVPAVSIVASFTSNLFSENIAEDAGGAVYGEGHATLDVSSIAGVNCEEGGLGCAAFWMNSAVGGLVPTRGGDLFWSGAALTIDRVISGFAAADEGGSIYFSTTSDGAPQPAASLNLTNSLISASAAGPAAAAVAVEDAGGSPAFLEVLGNTVDSASEFGVDFGAAPPAGSRVFANIIQATLESATGNVTVLDTQCNDTLPALGGPGDIAEDPMFVPGGYALDAGSPARDACSQWQGESLDGLPRNGVTNMGALEQ